MKNFLVDYLKDFATILKWVFIGSWVVMGVICVASVVPVIIPLLMVMAGLWALGATFKDNLWE